MGLFPLIEAPDTGQMQTDGSLPLCREVDWNFETNRPVWRGGQPVFVTGARAVLVWAWNALRTRRFAHDIFSANYGQDLSQLIGRPYSDGVRQSEAIRILRDTLLVNPYITAVEQVDVAFEGSTLHLTARLKTIYGEEQINGLDIAL